MYFKDVQSTSHLKARRYPADQSTYELHTVSGLKIKYKNERRDFQERFNDTTLGSSH
jgi:hypothetical protein